MTATESCVGPARYVLAGAACAMAIAAGEAPAAEVAGVGLPERIRLAPQGDELVLNGAGPRTRAYKQFYVAALYLGAKRGDARLVLADPGPKRLSLTMLRATGVREFADALLDGVREGHTPSELESLKVPLDELLVVLAQIGTVRIGTVVALDYLPGAGTRVTVNGAVRGKPIAGDDLYPALLRAWLGEDAIDRGLRRALLGSR